MQVQTFLLQRPDPALHDPVALGLAHITRRGPDPEPAELAQELMGRVLRPVVHPQPQAERDLRRIRAVRLADALADRLERRPPIPDLRHVPPHDVFDAVIDGAEEPTPPLPPRGEQRRIGPPEFVRPLGRDRAGVGPITVDGAGPRRRQEPPRSHQP